jgi:cytochrome c oxidase subunit 3
MSFAALTSALYVREGSGYSDWTHIALPSILWFNTLALVLSSVTLERARHRVAAFMRGVGGVRSMPLLWLNATMVLGVLFVLGQYFAWLKLT